jgi:hypothetical protein
MRQLNPNSTPRTGESLRNKFKSLRSKAKPTGDPSCPPEVVRAKRAHKRIEEKMGVCDFDDDLVPNYDENTPPTNSTVVVPPQLNAASTTTATNTVTALPTTTTADATTIAGTTTMNITVPEVSNVVADIVAAPEVSSTATSSSATTSITTPLNPTATITFNDVVAGTTVSSTGRGVWEYQLAHKPRHLDNNIAT